jgi:DNA-binding winged helix-turn-helix (wHTH) protein/predicted ATPase
MQTETLLVFDAFRVDCRNECVWHGKQATRLTPKAFAVLRCLAEQPGQLVTKDDLWRAVWQGVAVTDATLTMCMSEIRKALGDSARTPRFIETVHRRGYRWITPFSTPQPVRSPESGVKTSNQPLAPTLVGRDGELTQLHRWLEQALSGEQQIIFVTGEPGIGKTALVEAFLFGVQSDEEFGVQKTKFQTSNSELPSTPRPWIARGHCVESYGVGEAYLPVLTALDVLCRTSGRDEVVALLRQHAPLWLVQLPSLLSSAEREELQRQVAGATTQRMLREMANFLAALTPTTPLVLVLEDLHWSDPSTVALLTYLARWQERLRLLVIGTYRPVEVLAQKHPLATMQPELCGQGLCAELSLPLLTEAAVAAYLRRRAPHTAWPTSFVHTVYQQTEGNPLFMVAVVEEWLSQSSDPSQNGSGLTQLLPATMKSSMPERLRQVVTAQMQRLSRAEQQLLEAASVAGQEFSAAEVAAALTNDEVETEVHCEHLARRQQFLRPAGRSEWPDGTVAARYSFRHALYQALWQERVKAGRWRRYHQHIGERKERGYGERAKEIAAELAVHFEQGRDYPRAIQYLRQAGENASRRSAHGEAISLLTKGLELLKIPQDNSDRVRQELNLQITLGVPLTVTKGYAAWEVGKTYTRALELCRQVGETSQLFPALFGLMPFYLVRAEYQTTRELGEELLRLARSAQDFTLLIDAHLALGQPLYFLGEFSSAREHFEQIITLYEPQKHNPHASGSLQDPRVTCLSYTALILWLLGYPEQALQRGQACLRLGRELSHPYSQVYSLSGALALHQLRREGQQAQDRAEELKTFCTEWGFPFQQILGTVRGGWALAVQGQEEEGIEQLRQGLTVLRTTWGEYNLSLYLALLAEVHGKLGQEKEGLAALTEALEMVARTGERFYEAELYRLKGELTLQQFKVQGSKFQVKNPQFAFPNPQLEAEGYFLKAIEIAQQQQAKSLELRATMSLAYLWRQQGKRHEAHKMLSKIYEWFSEGFDTKDLQEAKTLIEELCH